MSQPWSIRRGLGSQDRGPIAALLAATEYFNREEIAVALELVDDRLRFGEESHYRFLVAEGAGEIAGYACWGPIPGSSTAADLYWIAVAPDRQGRGVGRGLLAAAEAWIRSTGRQRVYIETATRAQYAPTRAFYLGCGYELVAELPGYYAPDDGKAIFVRVLSGSPSA